MPPETSALPAVLDSIVRVRCELCGRRHVLERRSFDTRCTLWLVCHDCEQPLATRFDGREGTVDDPRLEPLPVPPTPPITEPAWWGSLG